MNKRGWANAAAWLDRHPSLMLALPPLFWAGNFVLGRAVRAEAPPLALAFCRWSLAFLLIAPFAWRGFLEDLPALRARWKPLLALSATGVAAFNSLVYAGLQTTTALNALIAQTAIPAAILVAGWLLYREPARWSQILGVLLSMTGAAVAVVGGDLAKLAALQAAPGDLLVGLAVASYGVYSCLLRDRPQARPLSFLFASFALGAAMLAPLFLWELTFVRAPPWASGAFWGAVGYVALFPSIAAYFCYNRGVQLVGAARAGLFIHLMPLYGGVMAALLLGEAISYAHGVALALILGGIRLSRR